MREITIEVTGEPVAKGRGRAVVVQGHARVYTPAKTRSWENDARQLARIEMAGAPLMEGPLSMSIRAYFPAPDSWPKWKLALVDGLAPIAHVLSPDSDNLIKACADSLNGVVYADDKAIASVTCLKSYSSRPRVEIVVSQMDALHSHSKRGNER